MSWDIPTHGMYVVQSETNVTFHVTQLLYNIPYLMISALTVDLFPKRELDRTQGGSRDKHLSAVALPSISCF